MGSFNDIEILCMHVCGFTQIMCEEQWFPLYIQYCDVHVQFNDLPHLQKLKMSAVSARSHTGCGD